MITRPAVVRRLAVALIALVAAATAALAQTAADEERLALAREHVKLFVVGQMIEQLVPAMSQQIADSIKEHNTSMPEEQVGPLAQRIAEVTAERMKGELPEMTAKLMAEQFTADEIRALTEFYSTPNGRAIVGKMGTYSAAVMQTVVPYVRSIAPEVTQTAIDQLTAEGVLK